jgi:hypothetical protein
MITINKLLILIKHIFKLVEFMNNSNNSNKEEKLIIKQKSTKKRYNYFVKQICFTKWQNVMKS